MDLMEFLNRMQTERAAWVSQLARVSRGLMTSPGVVGAWSVKDMVAHITWSEREMVGILQAGALVGSDLWSLSNDERNEIVYQQNRERLLDEVLAEADAVYQRLLELVSAMSEADLNDPQSFADMPADWAPWRVMAGNTYIHYHEHAQDLKAWLDAQEK